MTNLIFKFPIKQIFFQNMNEQLNLTKKIITINSQNRSKSYEIKANDIATQLIDFNS